jgi:hypothetical protein
MGEKFKKILQQCEDENYEDWDVFQEVFIERNRAILGYIEALKNYEKSKKFQKYEAFLKKSISGKSLSLR